MQNEYIIAGQTHKQREVKQEQIMFCLIVNANK